MGRLSARRFGVGAGVAIVVITALLALLAPSITMPGAARAVPAAELSRVALDQLGKIGDLRLRGEIENAAGTPLAVDIVALAGGRTTATVSDGGGGTAVVVAQGDDMVVKANAAWWLNTLPAYQLGLADKWVRVRYDMGFPVDLLRTLSGKGLSELIAGQTRGGEWTSRPTTYPDGTPAFALTAGDLPWTVYLAVSGGRLLGIDGPLAEVGDRLRGQAGASAFPFASVSATPVDDPCKEKAEKESAEAEKALATAPEPPPAPTRASGPMVSVQIPSTGVCSTPSCPTQVVVTNAGDTAASGTLMVSSTSGGGGTQPVTVGPGQTTTQTFSVVNPARTCTRTCTRPYTVTAHMQVTSIAGPDVAQGKRLNDQGIDPNRPAPARPDVTGPGVNSIIDGFTRPGPAVAGLVHGAQDKKDAVDAVVAAVDNDIAQLVLDIVHSGAVAEPDGSEPVLDLAMRVDREKNKARKDGLRQTLQLLRDLAVEKGRRKGSLVLEDGLILDNRHKRAYSAQGVKGAQGGAEAAKNLTDAIGLAIDAFDAAGVDGKYARVVSIDIRPSLPSFGRVPRNVLIKELGAHRAMLRSVLVDGSGAQRIAGLLITNQVSRDLVHGGRHVLSGQDLVAFTAQRAPNPPTAKPNPTQLVFTDANKRHMLEGDPYESDASATNPTGTPTRRKKGGHQGGAGGPGKTEFPVSWTYEDIRSAIQQVVANGTAKGNPSPDPNHMGGEEWAWRYSGPATIRGVTVNLDVIVYDGGVVRNAYPNQNNQVRDHTSPDRLNPDVVFVNPEPPGTVDPVVAGLPDAEVRYDRGSNTWQYTELDSSGGKTVYTTDDNGDLVPGTAELPNPAFVPGPTQAVSRC